MKSPAITSAIGASFGGSTRRNNNQRPRHGVKKRRHGLAVMLELPLVIVNVQRGGPSTGLPTKTEQADLLQAVYGRNGEAPIPVIAACTPADCFIDRIRSSTHCDKIYDTGYLPFRRISCQRLQNRGLFRRSIRFPISVRHSEPTRTDFSHIFAMRKRCHARGLFPEHRDWNIASAVLKKSTSPAMSVTIRKIMNSWYACVRQKSIDIAEDIPLAKVEGDEKGDLLVLGWGGTYGAIRTAVEAKRKEGKSVSHLHLKYINPLQKNLGEILYNFKQILDSRNEFGTTFENYPFEISASHHFVE